MRETVTRGIEKQEPKERWINIRVRGTTLKRLKINKATKDFALYDDVIIAALDKLEGEDNGGR